MKKCLLVAVIALTVTGTASAQWTPTNHGDPRVCPSYTSAYCLEDASLRAFYAKYQRIRGFAFAGSMHCTRAAGVAMSCVWNTYSTGGPYTTVVRFAHKVKGWTVAVGVIPMG